MIDQLFAEHFSAEWIAAWNNHDIPSILSHYSDDFEMTSPVIASLCELPFGKLKGKAAVGEYWQMALTRYPQLQFKLIHTLAGVDSICLCYQGVKGVAAEVFHFNDEGKVIKAFAHY